MLILFGLVDFDVLVCDVWCVVGDFVGFLCFIMGFDYIDMIGEGVCLLCIKYFVDGNVVVE